MKIVSPCRNQKGDSGLGTCTSGHARVILVCLALKWDKICGWISAEEFMRTLLAILGLLVAAIPLERRLGLPRRIENWSLTSLQHRLVKTGGRLMKHVRFYWLLPAEGHLTRRRFGAMLGRIALLPIPTG